MKRIATALVIALTIVAASPLAAQKKPKEPLLACHAVGMQREAIVECSRIIGWLRRELAKSYNNRGVLHFEIEQHQRALADYTEAIRIEPREAVYYYGRAVVREEIRQRGKAIADYRRALRRRPDRDLAARIRTALKRLGAKP